MQRWHQFNPMKIAQLVRTAKSFGFRFYFLVMRSRVSPAGPVCDLPLGFTLWWCQRFFFASWYLQSSFHARYLKSLRQIKLQIKARTQRRDYILFQLLCASCLFILEIMLKFDCWFLKHCMARQLATSSNCTKQITLLPDTLILSNSASCYLTVFI